MTCFGATPGDLRRAAGVPSVSIVLASSLLICIFGSLAQGIEWQRETYLAAREQMASARIVRQKVEGGTRSSSTIWTYSFQAMGREFQNDALRYRSSDAVGQFITVYYDPRNPRRSSDIDFAELAEMSRFEFLCFAVGAVAVASGLAAVRRFWKSA
jgi:hypothetical protein